MQSKKSKKSKDRDENKPKKATTAFMLWLNETREEIKKANPGITITEVAKKGGEMWREMKDKSVWEEKAAKDKERYANEMKSYKPPEDAASSSKRKHESPSKKNTSQTMSGAGFKSKEYISEDSSSEGGGDEKKKKKVILF